MLIILKKSEEKLVAVVGNTQFYKAEAKQSENVPRCNPPYLFFYGFVLYVSEKVISEDTY